MSRRLNSYTRPTGGTKDFHNALEKRVFHTQAKHDDRVEASYRFSEYKARRMIKTLIELQHKSIEALDFQGSDEDSTDLRRTRKSELGEYQKLLAQYAAKIVLARFRFYDQRQKLAVEQRVHAVHDHQAEEDFDNDQSQSLVHRTRAEHNSLPEEASTEPPQATKPRTRRDLRQRSEQQAATAGPRDEVDAATSVNPAHHDKASQYLADDDDDSPSNLRSEAQVGSETSAALNKKTNITEALAPDGCPSGNYHDDKTIESSAGPASQQNSKPTPATSPGGTEVDQDAEEVVESLSEPEHLEGSGRKNSSNVASSKDQADSSDDISSVDGGVQLGGDPGTMGMRGEIESESVDLPEEIVFKGRSDRR